jgi:5-methylcytosine-specific restriction endonuclease McrA
VERIKEHRWNRKQLLQKHNGRCAICAEAVELSDPESRKYATIDHIVPISRGGQDALCNMQLACRACNEAKGNTHKE